MKLYYCVGWNGEDRIYSEKTTGEDIITLMASLDWNDFNGVTLTESEDKFITVSGNIDPDGLSIWLQNAENVAVSGFAPESPSALQEALLGYLNGTLDLEKHGLEFDEGIQLDQVRQESDWLETRYLEARLNEELKDRFKEPSQKSKLIKVLGTTVAILCLGYIGYLKFTNELQFLFQPTSETTAIVTDVEWYASRSGYYQLVKYEFKPDGSGAYTGEFRGDRFKGKHQLGDLIRIKYAIDDPTRSKWMAKYKRK